MFQTSGPHNKTNDRSIKRLKILVLLVLVAILICNWIQASSITHATYYTNSSAEIVDGPRFLDTIRKNGNGYSIGTTLWNSSERITQVQNLKTFCLVAPLFGRTNNNMISIGKLLKIVKEENEFGYVGLDANWSQWYQQHFDPRPEIVLFYSPSGECVKSYDGRAAYFLPDWGMDSLVDLVPKSQYREEAEATLKSWPFGHNYISVHRRHLEGHCKTFATCAKVKKNKCVRRRDPNEKCSPGLRLQACEMEYNFLPPHKNDTPVVLFTDGQVPEKDATFPNRFTSSSHLLVEMLLMVKSTVHWGNPRSTLDVVVASWRRGQGMEPRDCYDSPKIKYLF